MEFRFDDNVEKLRIEIRQFVRDELPPEHIGIVFGGEYFEDHWKLSMETSKKLAKKGWLTMSWPEEYGGRNAPFWEQVVFMEECGYWGIPGFDMGSGGTAWIGPTIIHFGTDAQKKKFLPPIAAGEEDGIWCTGYSEPDAGSDLANLRCRAERHGDEYIINGQKIWTSTAHWARWCYLACRTDPNAKTKHQGISTIIVDLKSEGITIRPIRNVIGLRVFNEVFFDDVRVPAENLVGGENNGWTVLMTALSFERNFGLVYGGYLQRLFDELVMYAKEQGLMTTEAIRHKLADLGIGLRGYQLNMYQTCSKMSQGQDVFYEVSRDKLSGCYMMEEIGRVGTEILGASSQTALMHETGPHHLVESGVKSMYWTTPGMVLGGGTVETQRNILARFGLQLPKPC